MRRPLPLEPEFAALDRLTTRAFVPGRDEPAWLALNNAAFDAHPEQGAWNLGTILDRERQAWFNPDDFLLHERDGRLAAFCWMKITDEEPSFGEIYVIAVDPAAHGHGLGRAMLVTGLDHLSRRAVTTALLYVDADNAAALHLYETTGFVVDHRDQAYVGDIAATRRPRERRSEPARLDPRTGETRRADAHRHAPTHETGRPAEP
jgi:mycothiol synthase